MAKEHKAAKEAQILDLLKGAARLCDFDLRNDPASQPH
jgi:hypothetical protein